MKIARARARFGELETECQAFFDGEPYGIEVKRDQEDRPVYFVQRAQDPPPLIAAIAGDAIQNLRSALDHVAYELVMTNVSGARPLGHVYFPIAESKAKYDAKKAKQLKGVSPAVIDAIDSLRPYKGGDDVLWLLHSLNNIDKHRLLVTVGSFYRSVDLGGHITRKMAKQFPHLTEMPELSAFFRLEGAPPLRVGDDLLSLEPGGDVDPHMQFRFHLAFHEVGICEGEPLMDTLINMVDAVEGVVARLDSLT